LNAVFFQYLMPNPIGTFTNPTRQFRRHAFALGDVIGDCLRVGHDFRRDRIGVIVLHAIIVRAARVAIK
ncbi:MAG: hypothetical protein AAB288_14090, partial [Acidobacteriota bacterium]